MAFDAAVVAAAILSGLWVSSGMARSMAFAEFLSIRVSVGNALLLAGFFAACRALFAHSGLYRSQRLGGRRLYARIGAAVSLASLLLALLGPALRVEAFDWKFLAVFWMAAAAGIAASRAALYRWLEAIRRRGRNLRHILIAGAGPRGLRFARQLEARPELGYRIVGFLDEQPPPGEAGWLGGLERLEALLRAGQIDEVAVALPIKSFYSETAAIIAQCEQYGVAVRVPGDLFDARLARVESEQIGDLSMLTLFTGRGSPASLLAKRAVDVTLSAAALLLLSPLLAVIALAIRVDSRGPALFRQLRVGYNGRRFRMLKFRTMAAGAEARQLDLESRNEVQGAAFKIRDDPRVTRLGRRLRRTSLDELPQLLNVLQGEMSLVGPRPFPLRDVERLSQDWQRRRFSVRPGLTCLWQAGGRHRIGFEEWMRLDLDYIDNWSLLLDLRILLRTVPALVSGAGAS